MSFNRVKKPREPKLVLEPGHRHQHGEVTADGHHRYCVHCDVFVSAGVSCGNCEFEEKEETA